MPFDAAERSMKLFAAKVLPRLKQVQTPPLKLAKSAQGSSLLAAQRRRTSPSGVVRRLAFVLGAAAPTPSGRR